MPPCASGSSRIVEDSEQAARGGRQKHFYSWRTRYLPIEILVLYAEMVWVPSSYIKLRFYADLYVC